jgi:hypothetical protein
MTELDEIMKEFDRKLGYAKPKTNFSNELENTHNGDIDQMLYNCSKEGELEKVKWCLDNGANVHAKGDYALKLASFNGHTEVMELLRRYM